MTVAEFNTAITADSSHQGTLLEFGPFIRMAYNFAGPSRSARQAVKEEREIWTNAPPTGSRRYSGVAARGVTPCTSPS